MGRLKTFLRYNTRHHIRWELGKRPQLNPISYTSGRGIRAISWEEPLWMFRLRQSWFAFAGRHKCGRRADGWLSATEDPAPDTWDVGPDGYRTCSYCGSIHFDDLMDICRKTIDDERYGLDGTTKSYKVYVRQPGVRNASEGAIKFYGHHTIHPVSPEDQELYARAYRLSRERFDKSMAEILPNRDAP